MKIHRHPVRKDIVIRPVHHRWNAVTVEHRNHGTSLPWKLSVGRFLALGATLNEATIELFAKVVTGDPLA
jgi:hypothetical protein